MANAATLKALADPLRIRIGLLLLESPMTVKELAAALEVPQTRLYYHVRILEQHDLIEVVERRMVSGIEERRYGGILDNWQGSPGITARAIAESGVVSALLKAVNAEIEVALTGREDVPLDDPASSIPVLVLTELMLNAEQLADVQQRVVQIGLDYAFDQRDAAPGARPYHFLFAGYLRPGAADAS